VREATRKRETSDVSEVGRKAAVAEGRIVEAAGPEHAVGPARHLVFARIEGHDPHAAERDERLEGKRSFQEGEVSETAHGVDAERL
jgi:hypothetical protein